MRMFAISLLVALLTACSDDPASVCGARACTGPAALAIADVAIEFPGAARTAFSGDTLLVEIDLQNRGGEDTDSIEVFVSTDGAFAAQRARGISASGHRRFTITLVLPPFGRPGKTSQSIVVGAAPFNGPTDAPSAEWRGTLPIIPTTIQLAGVPAELKYPSRQTFQLIVSNPSPRPIPAAELTVLAFDIDYVVYGAIAPVEMPEIAAGETRAVPAMLALGLVEDPDEWQKLYDYPGIDLIACYPDVPWSVGCAAAPIRLTADYEGFCAVRRLTLGVSVTASVVGRCGYGRERDQIDFTSLDLVAGQKIRLSATGVDYFDVVQPRSEWRLLNADGRTGRATASFTAPVTGRFYVVVHGSGEYTLVAELDAAG